MTRSSALVLDHLVWACQDLDAGVARVAELVGCEAVVGGSHPAWGTRNALLGLGAGAYLEIVAPDPGLPVPPGGRGLGVETAGAGRLATWAARVEDPAAAVRRLRAAGVDLGAVMPGERRRPDGALLSWTLTDPGAVRLGGVVPFAIDWGDGPHPSVALEAAGHSAGRLEGLLLRHPEPDRVRRALAAFGPPSVPVEVEVGEPGLEARLSTPRGRVTLR